MSNNGEKCSVAQHPLADGWKEPVGSRDQLVVYNSLTRTKTPFKPINGNHVRWYNCGPTVYDASHIGHARNYVTFDIIRRILEDYFGYDVTLIMNITDIDDKIILRARQKHLFEQFCSEHTHRDVDLERLLVDYLKTFLIKRLGTDDWAVLDKEYGSISIQSDAKNVDEKLAKKVLHYSTASAARRAMDDESLSASQLCDAFCDVIVGELDAALGSSVTEHSIFNALARHWESDYLQDMQALNVRPASLMTRVSEFVPQVVNCIERIIANGYAYEANGSVYFSVASFVSGSNVYAKLCPWSAGNSAFFEEGEGALGIALAGDKRDPRDFCLWKASKAGEPFWNSPWGIGRPGWHIECSAMAAAVAPGALDIHSGGIDLAFPHHDNEMAQAEAYYNCCGSESTNSGNDNVSLSGGGGGEPGKQWVNYFMHAGHVHIEGLKMSKSLKNFVTIKDALERYPARQLRMMFLQHTWSAPVYFKESSMVTASSVDSLFLQFLSTADAMIRGMDAPPCGFADVELELQSYFDQVCTRVHAALCDSFDTPTVILLLQELVGKVNVYMQQQQQQQEAMNLYLVRNVAQYVHRMLSVFGLVYGNISLGKGSDGEVSGEVVNVTGVLESVSRFRDAVRSIAKNAGSDATVSSDLLQLCDVIRSELSDFGVLFEDSADQGSMVKILGVEEMKRMKAEQEVREMERLTKRMEQQRLAQEKAAALEAKAQIDPATLLKEFTAFDESGMPTHGADGEMLSKSARKKFIKEYTAQVQLHEKWLAKNHQSS